jgi:glycosyltransferase involved in cell wall biosynthesis
MTVILSHAVIAISDCDRRTAPVILFRKKIRVVHAGVGPFALLGREEARRFLAPGIPELAACSDWIVMNSELTANKAVDSAIHAFAGVSTRLKGTALVIISEGEERERLARLIESYGLKKRAFLLGFVPDARRYLAAADVFLMPSRKEGLPLALLEAGHAALPVIASRTGGIPEIIEHGKNGLLVRPDDIDAIADSLTRMLTDRAEARAFGMALQRIVRERFSEEEMFAQTVSLYIKSP